MSDYRIGAHTYIFEQYGYNQSEQLNEIFEIVAKTGFQAIELCRTALEGNNWREQVEEAVAQTGLELVGASNGQPLWDIEKFDSIMAKMDEYSDKLAALGEGLLCGMSNSGKRYADRTEEENQQVIKAWVELGNTFRSKGVVLNYHTHGEPIEDINHVIGNVPAKLVPLGPDLDWLRVGGIAPDKFLRENAERLVMLHIRDYHIGGNRTEALGEGDVDYRALGRLLDEIGFHGEFVVELALPSGKEPMRPLEELLRSSREHLQATIGK